MSAIDAPRLVEPVEYDLARAVELPIRVKEILGRAKAQPDEGSDSRSESRKVMPVRPLPDGASPYVIAARQSIVTK